MSSLLQVYAVPLYKLNVLMGSRSEKSLNAILLLQQDFLLRISNDDEEEITCAQALAELVNGEVSSEHLGHLYGYALQAICAAIGKRLPDLDVVSSLDWINEFDQALAQQQIPLSLMSLMYCGPPVAIPRPDDFPFIGGWTPEEVAAAVAPLDAMNTDRLNNDHAEALRTIKSWVKQTVEIRDAAIIGFYY
ncbi:MAG: hypothetical protein JNG89_16415 [Planctomycetaceae bacterium]|nr:hypothetical protein [Planctomycetaceae bacterium]